MELRLDGRPGRGDECPNCGADIKVCLNCRFFSPGSYNDCTEPQAERVVDKDKANYCEYFEFKGSGGAKGAKGAADDEDPLGKLEDLFK
jgi:hypothetical protein